MKKAYSSLIAVSIIAASHQRAKWNVRYLGLTFMNSLRTLTLNFITFKASLIWNTEAFVRQGLRA